MAAIGTTAGLAASALAAAGWAPARAPAAVARVQAACRAPAPAVVVQTARQRPGVPSGLRATSAPAAVIRVDQIGYPRTAPKLAVIMTRSRTAEPSWELISRGTCRVVAHGVARDDLGSWSSRYPAVWAVRLTGVRSPGTYRLALVSPVARAAGPAAVSPWFRIGPASRLYAGALANALSFYQNERDGPDFIRSALRTAPGHLNDARAMTFRPPEVTSNGNFSGSLRRFATGGRFDAGDYLKFVETTSYAVAMMLQGVAAFPSVLGGPGGDGRGAGSSGGRVSFTAEAKFGLDFLRRMWHERTKTLYFQVGTGEANRHFVADHDIWRLPQADDHYRGTDPRFGYIRHPPVFRAGPPGAPISPNLAGRLAADFALCYQVFRVSRPRYT